MTERSGAETPVWNISADQWRKLVQKAESNADALEDGAYVRVEAGPDTGEPELVFYATALNKPSSFAYPLLESIPGIKTLGALLGRAWHEAATGFVQFEVSIPAAAETLAADYESGVSDLDFVTYEQAVEQAVRGTAADWAWLHTEFGRLMYVSSEL